VIVENRPGGGNVIGAQAAARSAPDGYTFFFATAAALVTDPYTFKSLPYDPMKAFVPVARVAEVSFLVMANPGVPAKNLDELIALARADPDKFSIGTSGPKRFSGMVVSWLNKLAGTGISQVPYTAMGPGIQDAIAGRVPLVILSVPEAAASLSSGALKPLAVTSLERVKILPDVPTIAETFPGFDFTGWMVLTAISGTPEPIVERVNREMDAIMKDPVLQERLTKMNFSTPGAGTLQQTLDYVNGQHAAWGTLVKEIGLQPE
jgi:tripartite-type tricarboxylate transporter receptor subunit TctC